MAEKNPPAATAATSAEERKQPSEWAAAKGHFVPAPADQPWKGARVDPRYAAADALHGWGHHAYHYANQPLLITEEEYEGALDVAEQFPCELPQGPALSPHCPHRLPSAPAKRTPEAEKARAEQLKELDAAKAARATAREAAAKAKADSKEN